MINAELQFFDAIKKRSEEHQKAFDFSMQEKLYSQVGSIIRQELDSLIRLEYYKGLNSTEKQQTLAKFIKGEKAFPKDADLVIGVSAMGWPKHIYDVGCSFIHLTQYHNWEHGEPKLDFTGDQRREIVGYVNWWQKEYMKTNFTLAEDFSFNDLVKAAPGIFNKLRVNLLGELK